MAPNMQKLMKQAQKMQAQMVKAQESLKEQEVEGSAGGNMVRVTMNGGGELVSLKIDPEVIDPDDAEMLEDLIMAAFRNAAEKVAELSNSTMGAFTKGMNIPGLG